MPAAAPARFTADSRYVLWVNGQEVGRGPARSQPARHRYDEYDLAPYLVEGTNVVAVLMTYYGHATSFWQPAAAGSSSDAVLVFEAWLGDPEVHGELVSERAGGCSAAPPGRCLPTPAAPLEGVPVEVCDARELPVGWHQRRFDDSGWAAAAVVTARHMGGLAESRPPTYPFGRLLPRGISSRSATRARPPPSLDSLEPSRARWTTRSPGPPGAGGAGRRPARDPATAELPATFDVGPGRVQHLAVDFGRIVAGFVELDVDAPAGTIVELHYREKALAAGARPCRTELSDPATGARYVARRWRTARSPRWSSTGSATSISSSTRTRSAATVTVSRVEVREHLYPRAGGAYFRSDDPALDALYRAGIRTVQLNSLDAYTDCPTREQRAWVGDGVVHQMVDLVTNEDWGLARNYLELGDSPRPDGSCPWSSSARSNSAAASRSRTGR